MRGMRRLDIRGFAPNCFMISSTPRRAADPGSPACVAHNLGIALVLVRYERIEGISRSRAACFGTCSGHVAL
jgi:hypothetical protein